MTARLSSYVSLLPADVCLSSGLIENMAPNAWSVFIIGPLDQR